MISNGGELLTQQANYVPMAKEQVIKELFKRICISK